MLEARHLVKQYHGVCALADVSFSLGPSDVLGYLGPNGSGKTTTIGILTGLVEPTRGQVFLDGVDIRDQLVDYRARLGYVPEEPHLYPYLSGREFLQLVGRLRGLPEARLNRKIDAFLELFGLATDGDAPMSSYSKGMRQKVLVTAALMHDPDIVIFDEPMSGLDATAGLVFRHLLGSLARAGKPDRALQLARAGDGREDLHARRRAARGPRGGRRRRGPAARADEAGIARADLRRAGVPGRPAAGR